MQKKDAYQKPFGAVTTLFFMWGFMTVLVDGLVPRMKEVFDLTFWQSGLVQFSWFLAYGIVSIPAGILLSRIGYKRGILYGLALAGVGCILFFPAAHFRVFGVFLGALFVLAGGITLLQVAANPYIAVLGKPERAASRLNLAQAFNSLGTTLAPIAAAVFLLSDKILSPSQIEGLTDEQRNFYFLEEAAAVQGPFIWLGGAFFLLMVIMASLSLPKVIGGEHITLKSMRHVLHNKRLLFGALGIFVYVGSEVSIASYLTNYFLDLGMPAKILANSGLSSLVDTLAGTFSGLSLDQLDDKGVVGTFVLFYWGMAMVGRFVGAYLTRVIHPSIVLATFGIGAIILVLTSISSDGFLAMFTILGVGFFNSVMFPTIFTLALEELGEDKPEGSGILCTAIFGGAIFTLLVGSLRDATGSFSIAYLVPVVGYLIILGYGLYTRKRKPQYA